jgi:hypothetical protein
VYDLSKAEFRRTTVESGQAIELYIPIEPGQPGLNDGARAWINFKTPARQSIAVSGTYNAATNKVFFRREVGPFAVPGTWVVQHLETPSDRAGFRFPVTPDPGLAVNVLSKTPDVTAPVYDLTKIEFHSPRNPDGSYTAEAGKTFEFSIPVKDDVSGIEPGALARAYFETAQLNRPLMTGAYDAATGKVRFKFKVNPFAIPGTWTLERLDTPYDRAGNSDTADLTEKKIRIQIKGDHPDSKAPEYDLGKFEFHTPARVKAGEAAKIEAGKVIEFSIPVTDDLSGIEDGEQCYGVFRGPSGMELRPDGVYHAASGRVRFKVDVDPRQMPGNYTLERVYTPTDRAGNSGVNIFSTSPIGIAVYPAGSL